MRENRTSGSMRGCRKRATSRRACALLYAKPLKELPPEMRAFRPDSAGDSRRHKKQIAVSPTHVCAFKCLPRKEIFRMLRTYTADAPRISIGTKG